MEKNQLSVTQILLLESLFLLGFSGFTKLLADDNTEIFFSIAFCSCVLGLVSAGFEIIHKVIFNTHDEFENLKRQKSIDNCQ